MTRWVLSVYRGEVKTNRVNLYNGFLRQKLLSVYKKDTSQVPGGVGK